MSWGKIRSPRNPDWLAASGTSLTNSPVLAETPESISPMPTRNPEHFGATSRFQLHNLGIKNACGECDMR